MILFRPKNHVSKRLVAYIVKKEKSKLRCHQFKTINSNENASYSKRVVSPTELSWHYAINWFFLFHHTFHDFHI
jgi:hypothetical protein